MTQTYKVAHRFDQYLRGRILDIGAGRDPIREDAEVFDKKQGDAEKILNYLNQKSYDTIYSSHCLEHMSDPVRSLIDWWGLLKDGGNMILIVPDYELYEQEIWPSVFNVDHKVGFTTKSEGVGIINIVNAIKLLTSAKVVSVDVNSSGYDYNLRSKRFGKIRRKIYWLAHQKGGLYRLIYKVLYKNFYKSAAGNKKGKPIDQTMFDAMAQIEIVLLKTK